MNRLRDELSPYLRQHAHNPVDWYPWGEEAFAKARAEDKPILLSIGYSACHWCHVMEKESFDDPEIAAAMNGRFVNIKVDREERPDVDHIYQLVVQLIGKSGGWPLTVFLTPKLRPFFGGTYFPNVEKHGLPSLPRVLDAVIESFRDRREDVESSARDIASEIHRVATPSAPAGDVPRDVAKGAASLLARRFDAEHGGFGTRPKFPNTMALELLLRAAHDGDRASLARADQALVAMRRGGLWDQLGGGYHRYSTDERWLVPHFEKMLYDNALLLRAHAEAFRATQQAIHAETVRGIAAYLEREMRSPEGLCYSTEDADTEGEEGRFFLWTRRELDEALGAELGHVAALRFGVDARGNFEGGERSVLSVSATVETIARELGTDVETAAGRIEDARKRLFDARAKRKRPFRDEKAIASWNGLMAGALAEASGALGDAGLGVLAKRTLVAVEKRLWDGTTLFRVRKDGERKVPGFLEDYADVASGALDVAESLDDADALSFARVLFGAAREAFWDEAQGAFYFSRADATDLIVRTSDAYDHAVPSSVATMAHVALRLAAHDDDPALEALGTRVLRSLVSPALANPLGLSHALAAMDRLVRGPTEILIVGAARAEGTEALLGVARAAWQPNRVLARVDPERPVGAAVARLEGRGTEDGRATAYVCRNRTCGLPITDPVRLATELAKR